MGKDILTNKDIKWPYQSKNWSGPKWVDSPDTYNTWKGMNKKNSSVITEITSGGRDIVSGRKKREKYAQGIE